MKAFYTILLTVCTFGLVQGQLYFDYIGGGHSDGITVTTSDTMSWQNNGVKTLDGSGLDNAYMEASRFLAQSTTCYEEGDIEAVMELGFEAWIDDQLQEPATYLMPEMVAIWTHLDTLYANAGEQYSSQTAIHFSYAYWNTQMTNEDLLRHRIAQSLSEILVVSMNGSDLSQWGEALCTYYDILLEHSFGNYEDLLNDVSKSFSMGYYLSHFNNPKTDTTANIRPDENYAREIMQLFSIGLYELNNDGTPKRDNNGNRIPTYDNEDIKELARVFTGMGAGALMDTTQWPYMPVFGMNPYNVDKTAPMQMFQDDHEEGSKVILKDAVINISGDGMAEVDSAISYLFHHNNVGPFLSRRLIQRLVKSNPSPQYIGRVADAFNDNGSGVRGDMKAVIKAILLDEEARGGEAMSWYSSGQFRNPTLRNLQFLQSQDITTTSGLSLNNGWGEIWWIQHWPLGAPSVFNFYTPDHIPNIDFAEEELVGPEFKIHNTTTAINAFNSNFHRIFWNGGLWENWENQNIFPDTVTLHMDAYIDMAHDPEAIINTLDKYLTHGQLTHETREIIRAATYGVPDDNPWQPDWRADRVKHLFYLFLSSPDYVILK